MFRKPVWRNGLWVKMWELGDVESSRKCTGFLGVQYYLMGNSEAFDVQQGVAQGCSLSPILWPFEGSGTGRARGGTK